MGSKQNTSEFLTRSGESIQNAVKYWNKYNWRWLCKQAANITVSGTDAHDLPYDFKDVYTLRKVDVNSPGALKGLPRRVYDRVVKDQDTDSRTLSYDLFKQGDQGKLSIHPGTDASELELKYYRRMWVPCSVTASVSAAQALSNEINTTTLGGFAGITNGSPMSNFGLGPWVRTTTYPIAAVITPDLIEMQGCQSSAAVTQSGLTFGGDLFTLDIPEDYENGILSWAAHNFLSQLGAPEGRLNYFISLSRDEFEEARAANERFEDQDIAFEYGDPNPYPHH